MRMISGFIIGLVMTTLAFAEDVRPSGFPKQGVGLEAQILTIDSSDYTIEADGLIHKVLRSVKVMTPDLDRVFLFQIKPGTGAVIIKDEKGNVTEIWLLPDVYRIMES